GGAWRPRPAAGDSGRGARLDVFSVRATATRWFASTAPSSRPRCSDRSPVANAEEHTEPTAAGPGRVQDRIRDWWNEDAATYDDTPSHAATDPVEAAAWRAALLRFLPSPPARVLDVGAGTGAMSMLAAELGFRVTALD